MLEPVMRSRPRAAGFSIVELLAGTAVGLAIVAAGTAIVLRHARESQALTIETRLTQDLRTAADIVARDLRRAGHWGGAASGVRGDDGAPVLANPYAVVAPDAAASDAVRLAFSRDATENDSVDGNERFGFRLRNGAIELQLGDGNWQALTDPATLTVTAFEVEPRVEETSLERFCAEPCAVGSLTCPPRQQVRSFAVAIEGRAVANPAVRRSVLAAARLRNGTVVGSCEA
jgi:prepilin peptidase dependent protein B